MKIRAMTLAVSAALLSACATQGYYGRPYGGPYDPSYGRPYGQPYVDPRPGLCSNCGLVERIERVTAHGGGTSGGGAVLGAIVGGALGNTVGKGDGRKAATVAGAVAGGLIGNEIERNQAGGGDTWYEVFVRMDNGERIVTRQYGIAGLREGSRVEIRDGAAFPR
jgi:outer membrane lipoprotein SlyB